MGRQRKAGAPVANGARLESDVLSTTASTSITIAGQIHTIVGAVDGQLTGSLLAGQWQGLGGKAAQVAWADLRSQLTTLETALQNIGSGLSDASVNYTNTDQDQQANINTVSAEAAGIPAALGMSV
jgi:WXG100 family type VII secretion target